MFILFAVFWLPAIGFLALLLTEYLEIRTFFKTSRQTTGKVIGTIGAQHKKTDTAIAKVLNSTKAGGVLLPNPGGSSVGGALLLVEYEHENGNSYQVRSKQSFNEVEKEQVTVDYNPEKPSDVAIEGYYTNTSYVLRLIGIAVLFSIPIVIYLLSE